jgi:hypothetical protein
MNYETSADRARRFPHNHSAFIVNFEVVISLFTNSVRNGNVLVRYTYRVCSCFWPHRSLLRLILRTLSHRQDTGQYIKAAEYRLCSWVCLTDSDIVRLTGA